MNQTTLTPVQRGIQTRRINRARKLILESIAAIRRRARYGWKMVRQDWGVQYGLADDHGPNTIVRKGKLINTWRCANKQVCAMAALIMVKDGVDDQKDEFKAAARILGCTTDNVGKFVEGYDSSRIITEMAPSEIASEGPWIMLGLEIRDVVFPGEFTV